MSRRSSTTFSIPPIPKVIHQSWIPNWHQVPAAVRSTRAAWVTLNPTWKYLFWGEQEVVMLMKRFFPFLKKVWEGLGEDRLIKKADLARLMILWYEGGLYVDMDLMPLRPLRINPLLTEKYIGCAEYTYYDENHRMSNGFLAAPRRSPAIMRMLKECPARMDHPVLEFLGPKVVSSFLLPEKILILPWQMVLSHEVITDALCHNLNSRSWGESDHGDEWYKC